MARCGVHFPWTVQDDTRQLFCWTATAHCERRQRGGQARSWAPGAQPCSTSRAQPPVDGAGLKRMKLVHSPQKPPAALVSSGSGWPAHEEAEGRPPCSQSAAEATDQPALSNTSNHITRSTFCSVLLHSHFPGIFTMNCLLHRAGQDRRIHHIKQDNSRHPHGGRRQ